MSQYDSKDFKELRSKWYKKLKDTGFKDAEQEDGYLSIWISNHFFREYKEVTFAAKQEYYRLAGQFLYDYVFVNAKDKMIWTLHAEGSSVRTIVSIMKKKNYRVSRSAVHRTIQRLARIMGIEWQMKK